MAPRSLPRAPWVARSIRPSILLPRELRAHPRMSPRPRAAADEQLLHVFGLMVRMRVVGEGDNPLLLLNGLTRPLESWDPLADALDGRTLISFDAPGVGGSPTPILPLSIAALAMVAASVLDEAGVQRADLIGFSHGGAVAQQLLAQSPSEGPRAGSRVDLLWTRSDRKQHRDERLSSAAGSRRLAASRRTRRALALPRHLELVEHPLPRRDPSADPCRMREPRPRGVPPANGTLLARRIPDAELVTLSAGHDLQRRGPATRSRRAGDGVPDHGTRPRCAARRSLTLEQPANGK